MSEQVYKVRDPQGNIREIRGPAGASPDEVIAKAKELFSSPKDYKAMSKPVPVDPTADMSEFQKGAAGVGKALVDTGRGLGQLFGMVSDEDVKKSRELDKPLMNTGAGLTGNIVGNVGLALAPGGVLKGASTVARAIPAASRAAPALSAAGSALLAPKSIPAAMAVGGGMGVVQPAESSTERVVNALMGAGISGAVQAAPRAFGRVLSPQTRPEAKVLMEQGIPLTPGQILGGTAQRVEDGLTSLPIMGDAINAAKRRGIKEFDRVAINRALEPIGKSLPDDLVGREAVEYAQRALSENYDNLALRMKGALDGLPVPPNALPAQAGQAAKPTFRQELDSLRQLASNLPEKEAGQLNRIIDNEVVKRFTPQGMADGQTIKDIQSRLGTIVKNSAKSESYDVRNLGDAVKEIRNALNRMVEDVNPGMAKELTAANTGYANFKRVQRAAGALGAEDGVFTPAQLHSAVKAGDWSKDKARFAVGEALMQDLTEAGKSVMGSKVPDSGTPFRAANLATVASGIVHPGIPLSLGAGATGYSPQAQKVIEALLTQRPEIARQLAPKISATAPFLTGASLPAVGIINANQ